MKYYVRNGRLCFWLKKYLQQSFVRGKTSFRAEKVKDGKLQYDQKQPSRGVLKKRYSEIMQQIHRKTAMPKCYFNKVAKQISLRHGSSSVNLLHFFKTRFYKNSSGALLLYDAELGSQKGKNHWDAKKKRLDTPRYQIPPKKDV